MTRCKYCGEPVIWITTQNGRPTLCDASEIFYAGDPRGPEVFVTGLGMIVRGREVQTKKEAAGIVRRPHFASCTGKPQTGDTSSGPAGHLPQPPEKGTLRRHTPREMRGIKGKADKKEGE